MRIHLQEQYDARTNPIKAYQPLGQSVMQKAISLALTAILMLAAFTGCGGRQAPGAAGTNDGGVPDTAQNALPAGSGWEGLFTYGEANALRFTVKAAIPGEEDAYEYPWGGYDDPVGALEQSETSPDTQANESPDAGMENDQLQQALEGLPPELREAAESAMREAEAQRQGLQEEPELPDDWEEPSNQPQLGGRLEFTSGDTAVIIEMSEYCVDADTTFTVTPATAALPEAFFRGGFAVNSDGEAHTALGDFAVITFLTREDPGEDVVIKSFGENGELEYAFAEVTRLGDTYGITGAVEHFSTVGYGQSAWSPAAELKPLNDKTRREVMEKSRQAEEDWARKKEAERNQKNRKYLQTIEFDEILFTTSASGLPLQLHLRAKLVEQPAETGRTEVLFKGKIWLKFYTWGPGGYGDLYMVCNDAVINRPGGPPWIASLTEYGTSHLRAAFQMTNIGGSKAVAEGVGSYDVSGKTYTNVQTNWAVDSATGTIKVTFTSMKGAAEKTFIAGRLCAKTQRQANKKLKWFLQ